MSGSVVDFQVQIASIMEVLANAAVTEICKVVDDGYAVVHLKMSQSHKENEFLRRKVKLMELQIARFRSERTKFSDGSVHNRFHGIRLLNRHNNRETATTGPTWQSRNGLSNRSFGNSSIPRDRQPIDVDQEDVSPSKHMDTKSDEKSAETEEGEPDLLIIKVEGETDDQDSRISHPARTVEGSRELTTQLTAATTEDPAFQSSGPRGNNYNNTAMEQSAETEEGEPDLLIIKDEGEADDQESRSRHPARTVEGSRELTTQLTAATTEDPAFQSSGPRGNNNYNTAMEVSGSDAVLLQSETGNVNQGPQQHTGLEPRAERQSLDTKCDMNGDLNLLRDSLNQVWREAVATNDDTSAAHTKVMDLGSGPVGPETQSSSAMEMRSVGLENHRFSPKSFHSSSEHVIVIDSVSSGQQVDRGFEWGQVGTATTPQVNGTGNKQGVGGFNRNAPMIHPVHPDSMRDNTTLLVAPGFHPTEKNTGMHFDTGHASEANKASWCSLASLHRHSEIPGRGVQQPAHTSLPDCHFRPSATTSSHSSNFATHFRPGTVERPYGCPNCHKKFLHESDLRHHMIIHTRKRAFACTLCEKSFVSPSKLQVHQNVHTGEKPFSCAQCGRRFSHSSNLNRHQKLHH
ncbi:zinc finger and BTB domain-containing protein 5-like isoform X1 [Salvelinus fontinalis]|uniref:zinc finger and BTB domain-containing protein 5-like isoform X1 n=1 Tax=Salvelinus fontinalis TaxID=8038 RepID=UPI00248693A3|nr:zinc finger and BTB domain-containing protein 5-like isoform X1 [Salvelinus fontinalis]